MAIVLGVPNFRIFTVYILGNIFRILYIIVLLVIHPQSRILSIRAHANTNLTTEYQVQAMHYDSTEMLRLLIRTVSMRQFDPWQHCKVVEE